MSSRKIDKLEQENKRLKQENQELKRHIMELNALFLQPSVNTNTQKK